MATILFDADHFKAINDTYGHQVGDEVITLIAKCAHTFFSKQEAILVRYGGDEFLVLCRVQHEQKLAAMLQAFQYMMHVQSYGNHQALSISIGATFYEKPPYILQTLIAEADAALYDVKQQGRQHFKIYERQ